MASVVGRRSGSASSGRMKSHRSRFFSAGGSKLPDGIELEIEKMLEGDVLSELMKELGEAMPTLKAVLIDERDLFLTQQLIDMGKRVGVVVNMMDEARRQRIAVDLERLVELLARIG